MTFGSAMPAEPAPSAPWIRNPELVEYFDRVIEEKRSKGVTIGQLCDRGEISIAQFKRWRGIGGPQSIPEPDNLITWCVGNGLDPSEPLGILGWNSPAEPQPGGREMSRAELRDALAEVYAALDDPSLSAGDAVEFAEWLKLLASQLRARTQRNVDE